MLAKNFLISHFKTQQVFVLFSETMLAYSLNFLIALCVTLLIWQENESDNKVRAKNGGAPCGKMRDAKDWSRFAL